MDKVVCSALELSPKRLVYILLARRGSRHAYFDGFQIVALSFIAKFPSELAVLFLT